MHVKCLQRWNRLKIRPVVCSVGKGCTRVSFYAWSELQCELCAGSYPCNYGGGFHSKKDRFRVGRECYALFEVNKWYGAYLLLELMTPDRNGLRGVYVIEMAEGT